MFRPPMKNLFHCTIFSKVNSKLQEGFHPYNNVALDISNFNNKNFHIDLSGSVENSEGKKDINKIDKLLNLVAKYEA